jgi:hypothetical protein
MNTTPRNRQADRIARDAALARRYTATWWDVVKGAILSAVAISPAIAMLALPFIL